MVPRTFGIYDRKKHGRKKKDQQLTFSLCFLSIYPIISSLTSTSTNLYICVFVLVGRTVGRSGGGRVVFPYRCELRDPSGGTIADVAWNPDQGLHLVTASGDDRNPVLKLWDLRSSTSLPLATLQGHTEG